jgi:gas vesicle protein
VNTSQLVLEAASLDPTLQLVIDQFKAMKDYISAGQEAVKSGIRANISAIRSGQEEFKEEIKSDGSAIKDEIKNDVIAMQDKSAGQTEFEEQVTDTLNKQLKGVTEMVQ